MKTVPMLVRREFWEHRVLWMAPVALCVAYVLLCVFLGSKFSVSGIHLDDGRPGPSMPLSPAFYLGLNLVFTALLYTLMAIVACFYLCDCLYAERKDRSILFWKSLPVSDSMTVLSKLLVGLIAVPLVVYALAMVTNLIAYGVFAISHRDNGPFDATGHLTVYNWLQMNAYLLIDVFVLALWFAPLAAYQMLVSAVVPRAVFVWTFLPPVALIVGERIFFGTWHIGEVALLRIGGVAVGLNEGSVRGVEGLLQAVNGLPLLARPDLWVGVAIAAVLVFVTIRIRRHRDDS